MRPRLYLSSSCKGRARCSGGMARVSAPISPPHMPRQWPPPSRPRISADTSRGSSSGTGLVLGAWRGAVLLGLVDRGLVLGVFVVEQDAVGRAVEVIVLAAVHRPEEQPDGKAHQGNGDRDQDIERGHGISGFGQYVGWMSLFTSTMAARWWSGDA